MNPGIAWSLLGTYSPRATVEGTPAYLSQIKGLTIRLAQVIGCHEQQPPQNGDTLDDLAVIKTNLW